VWERWSGVREALDKLELVHDLAALVSDLLLGTAWYVRHLLVVCRIGTSIRIELVGTGTILEGDLLSDECCFTVTCL